MLSSDIAHSGLLEQIVQPGPNCALFQGLHFSDRRVRIRFAATRKFSGKTPSTHQQITRKTKERR
jgi:hypothetical protein